ncbi:LysR family transcriptional regulator [Lentilitoribacter sp. Alg239-R112]|uniref:LysR family transcriptional regulator n=1 Tax=Lentilitoribacter sp. Alg239-R112 TaxID=2305987 RepID=UPI0013A6BEC8|nr:LysR family transcriptional regulator [Lentilitoribacter sp. Alg239-R112]
MDNWNEIRTAAQVAKLGTISAASEVLGVHRATVTRHIDALESSLGGKLFQRHTRGFTPTELGQELLRIAEATDEQFSQLRRISDKHSTELTGDLIVTSIEALAPYILPLLAEFREQHPQVKTKFLQTGDVMKLEYGEAHIAFRAGSEPQNPDNVVQPFIDLDVALYAAKSYVAKYGRPTSIDDFPNHHFVGPMDANPRAPFYKWLTQHVGPDNIAFASNHVPISIQAVRGGNGIGFLTVREVTPHDDLVEIMPSRPEWATKSWLVTHVDLHRSPKIQAFMNILKANRANL